MSAEYEITDLDTQEMFEELISKNPKTPHAPIVIIKFGATWCGPCKNVRMKELVGLSDRIKWYNCDLDDNDYTPGYAGVRKIPAFLAIVNGTPRPLLQCSDTPKIIEWIRCGFVLDAKAS
jgi:thioredoxin-like negative regulator of GroEL